MGTSQSAYCERSSRTRPLVSLRATGVIASLRFASVIGLMLLLFPRAGLAALSAQSAGDIYPPDSTQFISQYVCPSGHNCQMTFFNNSTACSPGNQPAYGGVATSNTCRAVWNASHWVIVSASGGGGGGGGSGSCPAGMSTAGVADARLHDGLSWNGTTLTADGACSSGSNSFTSASGNFTSADVGKILMISCPDGGAQGPSSLNVAPCGDVVATISAVASSTQITFGSLAQTSGGSGDATCAHSVSNARWAVGTNNAPIIGSALAAGNVCVPTGNYLETGSIRSSNLIGRTLRGAITPMINGHVPDAVVPGDSRQPVVGTVIYNPQHGQNAGLLYGGLFSLSGWTNGSVFNLALSGSDKWGRYDIANEFDGLGRLDSGSSNQIHDILGMYSWSDAGSVELNGGEHNDTIYNMSDIASGNAGFSMTSAGCCNVFRDSTAVDAPMDLEPNNATEGAAAHDDTIQNYCNYWADRNPGSTTNNGNCDNTNGIVMADGNGCMADAIGGFGGGAGCNDSMAGCSQTLVVNSISFLNSAHGDLSSYVACPSGMPSGNRSNILFGTHTQGINGCTMATTSGATGCTHK